MEKTGMKLKVSFRKAVRRTGVLLRNIFRLRTLWDLVHPGEKMRWYSLEQIQYDTIQYCTIQYNSAQE